jgi:hypothetical protein
MKIYVAICILIILSSCKKSTPLDNLSFDYLLGNWERINEKDSLATFENWSKIDNLYLGHSYTLKATDTIWQEHIEIKKHADHIVYEVSDQPQSITTFMITSHSDTSFVCENAQNEFPKKIAYSKKGANLAAIISGGGPEILFEYAKK